MAVMPFSAAASITAIRPCRVYAWGLRGLSCQNPQKGLLPNINRDTSKAPNRITGISADVSVVCSPSPLEARVRADANPAKTARLLRKKSFLLCFFTSFSWSSSLRILRDRVCYGCIDENQAASRWRPPISAGCPSGRLSQESGRFVKNESID
jgi:hypothetical protein